MFDILRATPSSAVATSGTITFAYPSGRSAGDYASYGHKAFAEGLQTYLTQDKGDFTVSFGASDITFTYAGTTSIPANTTVALQANYVGQDDRDPSSLIGVKRTAFAPLARIDLGSPDTADADGILESQNLTSAGVYSVLAFNGVYGDPYGNSYAVLDVPRNVVAAWTGAAVLTVTGLDEYGNVMIESSASGTSFAGKKAFARVTSIAVSANVTAITVGTGDVLGLPVFVEKVGQVFGELQDGVMQAKFSDGKILIPFDFNQTDLLAPTAQNLIAPTAGYITGLRAIVQAAVTTGGAITVEANTVAVVGLSVTVADAATAGTVLTDDVLKIATGLCAAGDDITVTPAAAFATAGAVKGYLIFEPIAATNGTFVAGVQTKATATTGDVRGTYDPAEACDGSKAFSLLVALPDPTYKGVDQYDG